MPPPHPIPLRSAAISPPDLRSGASGRRPRRAREVRAAPEGLITLTLTLTLALTLTLTLTLTCFLALARYEQLLKKAESWNSLGMLHQRMKMHIQAGS